MNRAFFRRRFGFLNLISALDAKELVRLIIFALNRKIGLFQHQIPIGIAAVNSRITPQLAAVKRRVKHKHIALVRIFGNKEIGDFYLGGKLLGGRPEFIVKNLRDFRTVTPISSR